MSDVLSLEDESKTSNDDSLNHYVCAYCYPGKFGKTICGADSDLSDGKCSEEEVDCRVCLDIVYCPVDHECTCLN